MAGRNIDITQNVTINGATVLQIFQNSTLDYTITGTKADNTPINVSGSKTLPVILGDMTAQQKTMWFKFAVILAARIAYLGDTV